MVRVLNICAPQKGIIYKTYFVPILTYGSETWVMKERDKNKMRAVEMKFQRSRVGVTRMDRVRNERVREMVREEPLQNRIERSRLQWYGHVRRMQEERIPKKMFGMEMTGRRPRGRPRDRWTKGVKKSVEEREVCWDTVNEERWWMDRKRWRGLCSKQTRPSVGNCSRWRRRVDQFNRK